jgi:hypothetical protein
MHRTVDADHGRVENRTCWAMLLPKMLGEHTERWKNLRTIAMIEATREINGVVSSECRYYISSLAPDAALILSTARSHWSIENKLP